MHGVRDSAGREEPPVEGRAKVIGASVYTWDLAFPRMLHGRLRGLCPLRRPRSI